MQNVAQQKLLQEIISKGDAIEELNDACEVLVEHSACSKVRDQAIDTQTKYTKLLTTAQGKCSLHANRIQDFFFLLLIFSALPYIYYV